jgi:hypothetical protein
MTHVHPTFAPYLASIAPPIICRRCEDVIDANAHTLDDCERQQIDTAMLAYKQNGGRDRRALAAGIKHQINEKSGSFQ